MTIWESKEESITLTLNFDGFEVPETGSVILKYGADSASETASTSRVSATSYTAVISNSYIQDGGWFVIEASINDGTNDITGFKYFSVAQNKNNTYLGFSSGDQTVNLVLASDSEVWKTLVDGETATSSTATFTNVLNASAFEGLSISKLKVATSGASSAWWANVCYEDSWDTDIEMEWDTDYTDGYSTIITDADYIANICNKGLWLAGGYTKFYVYYVAK